MILPLLLSFSEAVVQHKFQITFSYMAQLLDLHPQRLQDSARQSHG